MKGLAPHTSRIFNAVSELECIKPYLLVGGTALPIQEMITLALTYSGHRLKTKNLLAMLTNGTRFMRDAHFEQLMPTYQLTATEIEAYIREKLK